MTDPERYPPIADHGVIGDLHTAALVSKRGSIDFLCFPEFDSPTVFAALLDADAGGHFRVAPVLEGVLGRQLYLPDSNVLLTRFLSPDGVAEVSDLMPIACDGGAAHSVIRHVKTVRGRIRYRMECRPRFDYGRASHHADPRPGGHVVLASDGPDATALVLRASVPLACRNGDVEAEFELGVGEKAEFVLEALGETEDTPGAAPDFPVESFKRTLNYWRRWIARSSYSGRWRETVNRSALLLKLLTSCKHGSMVAAPTFGLPETLGGERNWDYRFTWIRDASFMLYALSRLGYGEEATEFMGWLAERVAAAPGGELQVLYGIDGRSDVEEVSLDHLAGYAGSRPVRIGNGAHEQLQLDIYGELLDAIHIYDRLVQPISIDLWSVVREMLQWLEENWRTADEGIWELRAGSRHFLSSRVLTWVAFDRAIRIARRRSLPAPHSRWIDVRDEVHAEVLRDFWCEERRAFVQSSGASALDASALLMPLVRFIGPKDPRWTSTLHAIEEDLVEDSLVHRYRTGKDFPDGLEGGEGTFNLCSFWFVECLSRAGRTRQARLAFEKMLGYANHLGLYSEELGPSGEHLGNFPQAFSHIGLISAAFDLDRRLSAEPSLEA